MQEEYKNALNDPVFSIISQASKELAINSYVIGGYVRDFLLGRKAPTDIDIVAVGSGIALAEKVAAALPGKPEVTIFKNFGTAMLRYKKLELEFVGARRESYSQDSRKPAVEGGSLEEDQNRRDFTVNALALSLNEARFRSFAQPFWGNEGFGGRYPANTPGTRALPSPMTPCA